MCRSEVAHAAHGQGIARVEATGHIRASDDLEQRVVGAETLTDVGIEIHLPMIAGSCGGFLPAAGRNPPQDQRRVRITVPPRPGVSVMLRRAAGSDADWSATT